MKIKGVGTYYHIMNRICGGKNEYPFDDLCKEKAFQIINKLLGERGFYLHEVIAFTMMDNHYHMVVFVPESTLSLEETIYRHNTYYKDRRPYLHEDDPDECLKQAQNMIDISPFVKMFQMMFTQWFNKRHNRRGSLWADRFKSTILEGKGLNSALWACVKYIELNPVRAGICDHPSAYRFCSWGRFKGSGKHPFQSWFVKHMKKTLGDHAKDWSTKKVFREFEAELNRTIANEKKLDENEAATLGARESMCLQVLKKSRYWADGVILGSKLYIIDSLMGFYDRDKLKNRQFSHSKALNLYCFKRLRTPG